MGRPKSSNAQDLLRTAMAVFRKQGFTRTTMRDLEEATGLHPGSLYAAYGSKQGLFLAALRAYDAGVVDGRIAEHLRREDDPLAGIRSYLSSTFEALGDREPGCLMTNTAIEAFGLDASPREAVHDAFTRIERGLAAALQRAQARGQIPANASVGDLAARLFTLYQGLLLLVRAGTPLAKLRAITADAIGSLSASPPNGKEQAS